MYSYMPSPLTLVGSSETQILDRSVKPAHPLRKLNGLIDLDAIARSYRHLYSNLGTKAIPVEQAFRMLVVQFLKDHSDREMEAALQENMAVKWFCGFELTQSTPDHSFFGQFRDRLGTTNLAKIFKQINQILRDQGLIGDTFSFIDASAIVTKTTLWKERDKALAQGEQKLNNANVQKYAYDPQAKWGCKGKDKYWFGYKRHQGVDMRQGMITKVVVTPGNKGDDKTFVKVAPNQGAAIMDKMYDTQAVKDHARARGLTCRAIKKNNRADKNHDLDRFLSRLRMPFEGVFSKLKTQARYRGLIKVQFQALAEALAHNLKRLIVVSPTLAFSTG